MPDILSCLEELERQHYIHPEESLTIAAVKDELIRIAWQTLGADAATVIDRIKEAPEAKDSLESVLNRCKKLVKLVIDERKADELMDKCAAVLARLS